MYQLNFMIDQLPESLNKQLRRHKHAKNRINKEWDKLIYLKVCRQLPKVPLERASVRIVRHYYRTLDYDGLVGSLKPVVDALISAGVLRSDSWNALGIWDCTQVYRPKDLGPLLTVTVIEKE